VVEDLHWVDPSTLELMQTLVEQVATARLMLLYTSRPEFRVPWAMRAHHAQIALSRLSDQHTRQMVAGVAAGAGLAEDFIDTVVKRTDGVPLFAEELTRLMLDGDGGSVAREIPVTLHDSLLARMDRLGPAKEVAQVGAVLGREFSYELLQAVSSMLFGWFGGPGIAGTAQMMEQLGFRPPRLQAVVACLVEGGAGLALAAGFLTPLAAAAFVSVMFVATVTVHLPKGFFIQNGGFEYTLALAAGALAVAFTGPGAISADAALGIDWSGPYWGVAALAIGLVGGGLQLMARWQSPALKASAHQGA